MKKLIPFLCLPFLTGCLSTAEIVKQLKDDPATVDITIGTVYGTVAFHRSFPTNYTPRPIIITNVVVAPSPLH